MVLKRKSICLILGLLLASSVFALDVPKLQGRVNDTANIINAGTEKELDSYLAALENQSGIQIVVLTIPSLEGEDIAGYAIKVAEEWKIGRSGQDDGALLLVALEERQVRIEVGYGLEGTLTDAKCGLIIRNVIIPEFKSGNYSDGILKGVKNMGGIVSGDMELVDNNVENDNFEDDDDIVGVIFMVIWLIFFFIIVSSKGGLWKWLFISRMFGGRCNRGSRGGGVYRGGSGGLGGGSGGAGGSRGSGFGGSSGCGFHGGGGHFGGGGASGHW